MPQHSAGAAARGCRRRCVQRDGAADIGLHTAQVVMAVVVVVVVVMVVVLV